VVKLITYMNRKSTTSSTGRTHWSNSGTKKEAILLLLQTEPHLTPRQVSERLNTTRWYVYQTMRANDLQSSPMNKRLCRLEEKIKALELGMIKVLTAKGLADRKSEFGL